MCNLGTLPERIKSKGEIEKIFTIGKKIISTDKKVKASYLLNFKDERLKIKSKKLMDNKN